MIVNWGKMGAHHSSDASTAANAHRGAIGAGPQTPDNNTQQHVAACEERVGASENEEHGGIDASSAHGSVNPYRATQVVR